MTMMQHISVYGGEKSRSLEQDLFPSTESDLLKASFRQNMDKTKWMLWIFIFCCFGFKVKGLDG